MKIYKLQTVVSVLIMFVIASGNVYAQPKREFRGAWVQCVNGQFMGLSTHAMQSNLTHQLDELQKDGANAVIFQVRPECDALYNSPYEPWSRFLTGKQGVAPSPYWDPLKWMVEQCHKRGMEIHAWINPYRAKTKFTSDIAMNHVGIRRPGWVLKYDGQWILNPGIPECREYICKIVCDIVRRYDIDGLHIDDYFYPYPVAGQKIDDARQFRENNNGIKDIGDWRRYNVNVFIKQMHDSINSVKPWVKFGVSPFGIYRNKKNSSIGSETNGLQNYDDLYADVLMWVNNGWVDYVVPQLYWEIGHKAADYETLIKWWNAHVTKRPLYIGEDIERTVRKADLNNPAINQMPAKFKLHNEMRNVKGAVLWYSKTVVDNVGNYGMTLRNHYWKYPALQPLMPFIDKDAPKKVRKMKAIDTPDGMVLFWTEPKGKGWEDKAVKYVVYRFQRGERINIDDPSRIVAITTKNFYNITENGRATYVVTALDRAGNESKVKKKKI